jgi:tetratricopeptide (TPR) repeat protein
MTRRAAIAIAVVLLAPFAGASLHAQRVTPASVDALRGWIERVNRHVPGRPDEAVRSVVAMTYAERAALNAVLPFFLSRASGRARRAPANPLDKAVATLARLVRDDPGWAAFMKRAAMLHADAVVFADRVPSPPDDTPPSAPPPRSGNLGSTVPNPKLSPLLINERILLTRDGELVGNARLNWNLPFARSLMDLLLEGEQAEDDTAGLLAVSPDDERFVARWYHAVAAFLFAQGMNGDSRMHLEQAARVLPGEPDLLFDRATYAEWFGLPVYQALSDARIPAGDKTNAEAERLYRDTLAVDGSYVEARVRLARLLDHRGRHDEAGEEIATALEAKPDGIVAFYAHIVAGRTAAARGRYEEALRFYRHAAALYGRAQSARLGASHASLMLADAPGVQAPLENLGAAPDRYEDPWLDYALGAGRDVDRLLAALWPRVNGPADRGVAK